MNKQNYKEKFRKMRLLAIILSILLLLTFLVFGSMALGNKILYKEAIKQGAENTVTGLKMVVACQQLSNVTLTQIKKEYIKTFVLGRLDA